MSGNRKLLKHSDPKVRLLAVGTLFNKDDPQALPAIAKLAGDTSETLPLPGMAAQAARPASLEGSGRTPPPTRKQTVGEAAMMLVAHYLKAAGCFYNPQGSKQDLEFTEYWNKYGNLDHCLSWFAVQLNKAMRGSRPPSSECLPEILQVRKRIDQLPESDRVWVLLGLRAEYEDFDEQFGSRYSNMLAAREELIRMLQNLGPDQVLAFLQRQQVTKDPDFQPDSYFSYQGAARMFVFKNAAKILRPEDADALLAQGKLESGHSAIKNPWVTGWWWIAASEVRKDQAERILLDGYETLLKSGHSDDDDVFLLVQKIWRVIGDKSIDVVGQWFFDAAGQKPYEHHRSKFIADLAKIQQPSSRMLLASLLQDPRAENLKNPVLGEFATSINRWVSKPVATREEIQKLKGQVWKGGGVAPEMVPGMLDRLRKSIPEWKIDRSFFRAGSQP